MLVSAVDQEIYSCGILARNLTICDKILQIKYLKMKPKLLASLLLIVIKHCTFNFRGIFQCMFTQKSSLTGFTLQTIFVATFT